MNAIDPGDWVAKVAMQQGITTNVVSGCANQASSRAFFALALSTAPMLSVAECGIEVEVHRGTVTMKTTWPASATASFSA